MLEEELVKATFSLNISVQVCLEILVFDMCLQL